ncbi:MAG: hypothetical protein KDD38_11085 [Bdellovibrionales bacterium]|nr:hypothetical protein [Bdellovibrionales bacterium]
MSENTCPRCGELSYENLPSYSHCYNCGYSPEYELIDEPDERHYFYANDIPGDEL